MPVISKHMKKYELWLKKFGLDKKKHQMEGMEWCLNHELSEEPLYGVRGGIISDEMGLGKTILMLGCIISNFKNHTLIVLPAALVDQWVRIISKLLGHKPMLFHGGKAKKVTIEEILTAPIVVTTYGMISARKGFESKLWKIKWDRVVFDEAHHLRNRKTTNHLGAKKLVSKVKWLVTGTPIQNRTRDFVSLCSLVGLSVAIGKCIKGRSVNKVELKSLLNHHYLRRTKKGVGIKLPKVEEKVIQVEWETEKEKKLAEQIHDYCSFSRVRLDNVQQIMDHLTKNRCVAVMRAKQSCILPTLLEDAVFRMKVKSEIPNHLSLEPITSTSKLNKVVDVLIERKQNKRKKLVFSNFRAEIDELAEKLTENQISVVKVDGRTKKQNKKFATLKPPTQIEWNLVCKKWSNNNIVYDLVEEFMTPEVMILQIQTGCEGLNLQHFQEVYFTSPHWNPAVENQAIARCHRIGQTKPVSVFRFIMEGFGETNEFEWEDEPPTTISVDQYCMLIQKKKRELMQILN
jgi:SNF2 family DNA or RNA helicase